MRQGRVRRAAIGLSTAVGILGAAAAIAAKTQIAPRAPDTVEAFLDQTVASVGRSESSVVNRLGEPFARTVDRGFNQHERDSAVDLVTLHYWGLSVGLVHVPELDKWLLKRIVMSDANWAKRLGFDVPRSRSEALETFGRPTTNDGRRLAFRTDRPSDPGADSFQIVFERDRTIAWIWTYWID